MKFEDLHRYGTMAKMVGGEWHLSDMPETKHEKERGFALVKRFNDLGNTDPEAAREILKELMSPNSGDFSGHAPLNAEYGCNITFGDHSFFNFGVTILAQAPVTFGKHTMIGPHCSFITVNHPVNDMEMRMGGWQQGKPITVGDNCWFGAHVIITPGVTIGDNCVFGAGTLVTKDVPSNSLVVGTPGRVVRDLSDKSLRKEREDLDGPILGFGALGIPEHVLEQLENGLLSTEEADSVDRAGEAG